MKRRMTAVLGTLAVVAALAPPAWSTEVTHDVAPPVEAFELIARSLQDLGATEATVAAARAGEDEGERNHPYVVPVGDLDGDGRDDVVTLTRIAGDPGQPSELVLTARRGFDGSVLWSYDIGGGGLSAIVPAAVGEDGDGGLLLVRYNLYAIVGGPGSGEAPFSGIIGAQYDVYVTAISGSGEQVWAYISPRGHFLYTPSATAVVQDMTIVAGTLQATDSPATDVLLSVYDRTPAAGGQDDQLRTVVLDGADGAEASAATTDVSGARTAVTAGPDLDGDGLDDYTILTEALNEQTASGIRARRGFDGQQLWARERAVSWTQQSLLDLGDVTGDGADDLALRHHGSLPSPDSDDVGSRQVVFLDGASGAQVWQLRADTARRLGDVSGDGRADVLLVTVLRSATAVGLRYEVFDADGTTVWETTHLLAREGSAQASLSFTDAGDADGDGIGDFAHHLLLRTGSGNFVREDARLIRGRDGATLREGPLGATPLHRSVSGDGDDLVLVEPWGELIRDVTALDGLTGTPLWTQRLRVRGQTSITGFSVRSSDVDGDGLADLVVNASSSTRQSVPLTGTTISAESFADSWVLSGRDGSLLWHSDPLVVPEPAEVDGRAEPGAPFAWEGAAASGTAATWSLSADCGPDNPLYRCDWLLVELANPPAPGEASRTTTATVEIGDFAPVPAPVSDFDLDVYDSDEFGTRGALIDSSGSFAEVESVEFTLTTTTAQPSRYILVKVEYFTSVESGYTGTVTIG